MGDIKMMNAKSRMRDFYAEGIIEMNTTFAAEGSYRGFKERGLTRLQGFEECFLFFLTHGIFPVFMRKRYVSLCRIT